MLAAMTDTKLAVKENEALLTLAVNLYHKGDIAVSYTHLDVYKRQGNIPCVSYSNSILIVNT